MWIIYVTIYVNLCEIELLKQFYVTHNQVTTA